MQLSFRTSFLAPLTLTLLPSIALAQLGDATVSYLSVSSPALAGASLNVIHNVRNLGPGNFWAALPYTWSDRVYLNTTRSTSGATVLATLQHWGTIFPGYYYSSIGINQPIPVTIPAWLPEGLYQLGYWVDYLGQTPETNNGNNTRWIEITVQRSPDYRVDRFLLGDDVAPPGSLVNYSVDLVNSGGSANLRAASVAFYLASNLSHPTNGVYLGATQAVSVGAGARQPFSGTLTIPAVTLGRYHVMAVADPLNLTLETNENNNTSSLPFAVGVEASVVVAGTPCGPVSLGATGRPVLGTTFSFDVAGVQLFYPVILAVGFDGSSWHGMALPASLASVGMEGCTLYLSPIGTRFGVATAGTPPLTVSFPIAVPANTDLMGIDLRAQGFTPSAGVNSLGMGATQGAVAHLGW